MPGRADNASLQSRIGQSYGEALVDLPGVVDYNPNPYGEYSPTVGISWQGPDGDVWKLDAPNYPLEFGMKGKWAMMAFHGLARNAVMAIAQIAEKPGLETVPITSNAVNYDVAYPASNFGPWLYGPMQSTLTG